jgi:hypothetical protein
LQYGFFDTDNDDGAENLGQYYRFDKFGHCHDLEFVHPESPIELFQSFPRNFRNNHNLLRNFLITNNLWNYLTYYHEFDTFFSPNSKRQLSLGSPLGYSNAIKLESLIYSSARSRSREELNYKLNNFSFFTNVVNSISQLLAARSVRVTLRNVQLEAERNEIVLNRQDEFHLLFQELAPLVKRVVARSNGWLMEDFLTLILQGRIPLLSVHVVPGGILFPLESTIRYNSYLQIHYDTSQNFKFDQHFGVYRFNGLYECEELPLFSQLEEMVHWQAELSSGEIFNRNVQYDR